MTILLVQLPGITTKTFNNFASNPAKCYLRVILMSSYGDGEYHLIVCKCFKGTSGSWKAVKLVSVWQSDEVFVPERDSVQWSPFPAVMA